MSLHLVKIGRGQAIVCSDGLGLGQNGKRQTNCEKLFATGTQSVCGIVGQTEWGPGAEIAMSVHSLLRLNPQLADSPYEFLTALGDTLQPLFVRLVTAIPAAFEWLLADTKLFFGAFSLMWRSNGQVTLMELRIPLESDGEKPRIGEPQVIEYLTDELPRGTIIFRLGCECLEGNRLNALRPDVDDDETILAAADRMIDGFKREHDMCAKEIGGVIEVAAIDAAGVRWLRQDRAKVSRIGRARRKFSSLVSWLSWAAQLARAARA